MGLINTVGQALWRAMHPRAQSNQITTSQELDAWLRTMGLETTSGVQVTAETAMAVSAVSAALSILAESVAQTPLPVYRRLERGKERLPEHPVARLLNRRPNRFQDAFQFREMMQMYLGAKGNAYAFKVRTGGELRELLPLHPDRVEPEQDERWRVVYHVLLPTGERETFAPDLIFHLRDRSTDGVKGRSRIADGRNSIGLTMAAESHGARFFKNGARPSTVVATEQDVGQEKLNSLAEMWRENYTGENAGRTPFLDHGFKVTAIGGDNEKAQFMELRQFQIAEVSRLFRVPPHMLGDLSRATFSNIAEQSIEFVRYSLMPWLRRWEMAVNTQLIPASEQDEVFTEFLVEGLLRGTAKERAEFYQIMRQIGVMSANDVRERENMNPIEDGDSYDNPAITPGDGGGDEPDDEPAAPPQDALPLRRVK